MSIIKDQVYARKPGQEGTVMDANTKDWRDKACHNIDEAREKVGNNKVVSAALIKNECEDSWPCQGHDGITLTLENGEIIIHECDSVSIGAIHYYFLPDDDGFHCREYVHEFLMNNNVFFYE